jgi:Uri superfamily endonuclease
MFYQGTILSERTIANPLIHADSYPKFGSSEVPQASAEFREDHRQTESYLFREKTRDG